MWGDVLKGVTPPNPTVVVRENLMPKAICLHTVNNAHGVYVAGRYVQDVDEASLAARPDAFRIIGVEAPVAAVEDVAKVRKAVKPKPRERSSR